MEKILDVYLQQNLIGHLIQNKQGQMIFEYLESWFENPNAFPLSHSLPLRKDPYSQKECRGYFMGLLPEENQRQIIARNIGISPRNDFALLQKIGGECAGAVTFNNQGEPFPQQNNQYRILSDDALETIFQKLPQRPLLAGEEGIRLSLAGVQDKIAAFVKENLIAIPLDSAASTHILKPTSRYFEGLVFNEAFCMNLAKMVGLLTAEVAIRNIKETNYLLIKRHDRKIIDDSFPSPKIDRYHQEDFCQALGIPSTMKYQNEGGPSLKQCFNLLREISTTPVLDLQNLLDAVIFNYIIGNHDAHGKNFSILYEPENNRCKTRLAPHYDIVSTLYYPELSKKMAMKIGGEYSSEKITLAHFEKLASEVELAKPLVKRRVVELAEIIISSINNQDYNNPVAERLIEIIKKRCHFLLLNK